MVDRVAEIESYYPEDEPQFTELVLDYFQKINGGARVDLGKLGRVDEKAVVAGIKQGINTRQIDWLWLDQASMHSDIPIITIPEENPRHVHVLTSTVWVEKCVSSVPEVVVPRRRWLGIEFGKQKLSLKETRSPNRIGSDDAKIVSLVKEIYNKYRSL